MKSELNNRNLYFVTANLIKYERIMNNFQELIEVIKRLRKECPWDREQTNYSISPQTIEEVYEVVEAVENADFQELKNELGDLLLHVLFHTEIASEAGHFSLDDVITAITDKLIRRHPHIFGNTEAADSNAVKKNWEAIKLEEGRESVLQGVPKQLPGIQRAYRLQEKASKVGFDWADKSDVWKKVLEEIEEMHNADLNGSFDNLESEVGDVLFAIINYSRFLGVNPETALRKTNNKFIKRFRYIEEKLKESGKKITESNLQEMDFFWNESKKTEG